MIHPPIYLRGQSRKLARVIMVASVNAEGDDDEARL